MKTKSKLKGSIGLAIISLLLLGFSTTFLVGCDSTSKVAAVDKTQASKADVNENTTQPEQGVPTAAIPPAANVSVDDLESAIEDNKGWQLIDVREPREFATGHIKMALNRPLAVLENNLAEISKDKDIVLIDLNGSRSETAWQVLVNRGYDQNKVKVLTGGMLRWRGIVSSAGSSSADSNSSNMDSGGGSASAPKPEVQEMVGGC